MFEEDTTHSSPLHVYTFEDLCAFIDASHVCPSVVHDIGYHLDDVLKSVENLVAEELPSPRSSSQSEPNTPVDPIGSTQSESDPSQTVISTDEDDDLDIAFDPNEWFVTPPSTQKRRAPLLYEFLRLLLNNSRYQRFVSWINEDEGLFHLHQPIQVANLWKQVKRRRSHHSVNYNTLARGIRSYYENGLMIPTRTKYTFRFAVEPVGSFCY